MLNYLIYAALFLLLFMIIYDIIKTRREAIVWWDCTSIYGKYILMKKYLEIDDCYYQPTIREITMMYRSTR